MRLRVARFLRRIADRLNPQVTEERGMTVIVDVAAYQQAVEYTICREMARIAQLN